MNDYMAPGYSSDHFDFPKNISSYFGNPKKSDMTPEEKIEREAKLKAIRERSK